MDFTIPEDVWVQPTHPADMTPDALDALAEIETLAEIEAAMRHEEAVDEVLALVEEHFPTGWMEFDEVWIHLRRERPGVPVSRCPTTRLLVGHNLPHLREMLGLSDDSS